MNVVFMMAGSSKGFYENGFSYSKFLSDIGGKPMLEHVIDGLRDLMVESNNIIFIIRREDSEKYYLKDVINILVPGAHVVLIGSQVSGAAMASLLAIDNIKKEGSLLLVKGDQVIEVDNLEVITQFKKDDVDAGVIIFESVHPRWSFVACDSNNLVVEAAEKRPISKNATAGFYYYKKVEDYVDSVKKMALKDAHVDDNFYICPAFNEMVLSNKKLLLIKLTLKNTTL